MSADASREAFEAWLQREQFLDRVTIKETDFARRAWQASRKQALEEVAALFPDISAGYRSTTIKQAIEELK